MIESDQLCFGDGDGEAGVCLLEISRQAKFDVGEGGVSIDDVELDGELAGASLQDLERGGRLRGCVTRCT